MGGRDKRERKKARERGREIHRESRGSRATEGGREKQARAGEEADRQTTRPNRYTDTRTTSLSKRPRQGDKRQTDQPTERQTGRQTDRRTGRQKTTQAATEESVAGRAPLKERALSMATDTKNNNGRRGVGGRGTTGGEYPLTRSEPPS